MYPFLAAGIASYAVQILLIMKKKLNSQPKVWKNAEEK